MKKNTLFLLVLVLVVSSSSSVSAQTKTPTPSPIKDEGIEQIQKIKDIVASKVAELNLVEKRGFIGTVASTSTSQITVKDPSSAQRTIDIDDLTTFTGDDDDSFGISDIKEGNKLIFIGLYNKDTKHLLARQIRKATAIPTITSGIATAVDTKNFVITIINENNQKTEVDVEKSTKTLSLKKGEDFEKSGFSKIKVYERVLIVGLPDPNDTKRINALRVIHFLDIAPSVKMKIHAGVKEATTKQ